MANAIFPDGTSIEAGWTPRNAALKARGHDVGPNDYDVVIHFDNCRKCSERTEWALDIWAYHDMILDASAADRAMYGIPPRRAVALAAKVLGY